MTGADVVPELGRPRDVADVAVPVRREGVVEGVVVPSAQAS